MSMGTRKQREQQEDIWIAHTELASAPAHPFYQRLNELLEGEGFDEFVESRCAKFYAAKQGRPSAQCHVSVTLRSRRMTTANTTFLTSAPGGCAHPSSLQSAHLHRRGSSIPHSTSASCVSDPAAPTAPASASPGPRPSPAPARTPRSSPPSRGGARARVGVLPPHNRAHRRVRLQRRCINANPLPPQQPTIRQQLQHPAEHLLMRLHIDQPPRARNRRMIRCLLV